MNEIVVTGPLTVGTPVTLAPPSPVLERFKHCSGVVDIEGPTPDCLTIGNYARPGHALPTGQRMHRSAEKTFAFVPLKPGIYEISMSIGSWRGVAEIEVSPLHPEGPR